LRHFAILGALGVLSLAAAAYVGPRLYRGNPTRSAYCKVLPCDELDSYDAMCRAASIAEFGEYASVDERIARLEEEVRAEDPSGKAAQNLEQALALDAAQRYPMLEGAARASGGPAWSCPALDRVVTSTTP
jgi:hypothetical protein